MVVNMKFEWFKFHSHQIFLGKTLLNGLMLTYECQTFEKRIPLVTVCHGCKCKIWNDSKTFLWNTLSLLSWIAVSMKKCDK